MNPIVGVYIPIIRFPIKGAMAIPNTTSLDPGSYENLHSLTTNSSTPSEKRLVSQPPRFLGESLVLGSVHTVDGRNPAPPGMYKTL